ncbi:MAG: SDR family NAD(P)-dependent oxidoreductase [Kordiimonadaceae bacterium]|nr:SDR family NAD(P)-dependent oxidoreductase [Kordiimonadaceae bacterium]MBO6568725.1 SDR family NAD(P)-dependent oxidoreductase [Kordiimonadaceae bacterium]MBO6965299.1 SDR family NAD(P)-dependent oxidoreductase [Kordiimonadaceae bacterium]
MKRLLITGASSGIGMALALQAAELGYDVTACGRNQDRLKALTEKYTAIKTLAFDVSDVEACMKALHDKTFDVVVLNAGTCEYVDMDSFDPDMFRRVFDANFFGAVNCLNALLPNLQSGHQLVFVDSLARLLPFTRSQAYGASKAALHYLAKTMEVDLASRGAVVQSISPGFVRTPLTDKNDFDMPMRVEVDAAANSILKLISRQKRTGYFPTVFAGIIRILGSLPVSWQVALCRHMKAATATKREAANETA